MIKNYEQNSYNPQKFKFKRLKNEIKFGEEEGYFKNFSLKIRFSSGEMFSADSEGMSQFNYNEGRFYYGASTYEKAYAISGNCSVFK